jgi:CubicO group peptidase (beta-lactamase class C family)
VIKAKIFSLLTSLTMLIVLAACTAQVPPTALSPEGTGTSLKTLDGGTVSSAELEAFILETMEEARVAGLSCAIINDSEIVYQKAFGLRDAEAGTPNDEETIFAAASFSKPVFAYLVMALAEEGAIDLDKPLYEYLGQPLTDYPAYAELEDDNRYQQITARMVLSHSTGFPNWRFLTEDGKLSIMFPPGSRYSYSGEGIVLLQMVVEEITGRDLEALAQEKVFGPLAMNSSSFVWQEDYEGNFALPHDEYGRSQMLKKQGEADAAGSMATTAGDYARFVTTMLNSEEQQNALVDEMLEPQIAITSETMFGPGAWQEAEQDRDISLSWGLGWGRFDSEHGRAFFHTGHDFGWQNYTVTYPDQGIGVVLLSNSDNFESVAPQVVQKAIGDTRSPFDWLGYVPFDPSQKKEPPPPEPITIDIDPAILESYVGIFELTPEDLIHIKLGDQGLLIGDGQEWMPLYAESETQFFAEMDDARVVFVKDTDGEVIGLSLTIQGMELPPAAKLE